MEPMDYTMDSDHLLHQHQHHQPQQNVGRCPYAYQSNSYNTYMPPRDTHHYDPVHNTDSWYQPGASTNPSSQPSYAPQPSHWANNRYYGNTWHAVGGERAPYNSQIPFHMPGPEWLHPHGFPLPFGYGYGSSYSSSSSGNGSRGLAETSNPRTSAPMPPSAVAPVNIPTSSQSSMMHTEPSSQPDRSSEPSMPSYDSVEAQAIRQRLDEVTVDRAAQGDRAIRDSYRNPMEEQRASYTHAARIYARTYTSQETAHWQSRRHRPSFGSSDDADDDSDDLLEHYHNFFPRDENSLAALRGIAASKRVTSKSAMASLEQVDLQELKEGDRTCIICYNEFGVKNPEGVVENPIRLPKCKHIFGNACIKKWFEDSDSCPYCRDKLPSEPLYVRHREIIERLARESREAQQLLRSSTARNSTAAEDVPSGSRNTEAAGRNQDQLHPERRMAQNSPPSRFSPADSPENSRRRRGRMGVHRALPPPRPFNQQSVYRTSASFANTANSNRASYVPQRNGHVPSRNTTSSSQEEASPPIVVGSSDMREQNNRIASEHESDNSWTAFNSSRLSARVTRPEASNSPPAVSIQTRPNLSSLSQHSASESSLPTVSDINTASRHQYSPWVDNHPSSTRVAQYPRWSS